MAAAQIKDQFTHLADSSGTEQAAQSHHWLSHLHSKTYTNYNNFLAAGTMKKSFNVTCSALPMGLALSTKSSATFQWHNIMLLSIMIGPKLACWLACRFGYWCVWPQLYNIDYHIKSDQQIFWNMQKMYWLQLNSFRHVAAALAAV